MNGRTELLTHPFVVVGVSLFSLMLAVAGDAQSSSSGDSAIVSLILALAAALGSLGGVLGGVAAVMRARRSTRGSDDDD